MIYEIIQKSIDNKASDIHISYNMRPKIRVYGAICNLENFNTIKEKDLESFFKELLTDYELEKFNKNRLYDNSIEHENSILRIHYYKQKGYKSLAIRIIPKIIPDINTLNLPKTIKKFTTFKNGLILITGKTGSGKSTTLACIIDEINSNYNKHILIIEDPIEYIHNHKKSIVNQIEIGMDIDSYETGIKSVLRSDPDIIVLGEMRDINSIKSAITLAETGHLVYATLHTNSVVETINRIIDVFPSSERDEIRVQLSEVIKIIMCQELVEGKNIGLVPVCEILIINDTIKNMIKTNKGLSSINDMMRMMSNDNGSITKIQCLNKLYNANKIDINSIEEILDEKDLDEFKKVIKFGV